jgi:hypothetical protein
LILRTPTKFTPTYFFSPLTDEFFQNENSAASKIHFRTFLLRG